MAGINWELQISPQRLALHLQVVSCDLFHSEVPIEVTYLICDHIAVFMNLWGFIAGVSFMGSIADSHRYHPQHSLLAIILSVNPVASISLIEHSLVGEFSYEAQSRPRANLFKR